MPDHISAAAPAHAAKSPSDTTKTIEAKAVLLGERIETKGFEATEIVSQTPLAFRASTGGLVVIYRFGAIVFVDVESAAQDQTVELMRPRLTDPAQPTEIEIATLAADGLEDIVVGSGKITLVDFSKDRLLIVADALAKSVALADDEHYMTKVFEQVEPFAQNLANASGTALTSKALLRLLGEALVAQARMVGRVEVEEKPDIVWDRPDLQRLYARLADEYELEDRARALSRKLKVIEESASTLSDVANVRQTLRLELAILVLIGVEILLSLFEISRSFH